MAERLTEKSKRGFYLKDDFGGRIYCDDDKETINAYYGQLLIVKLGRLEDLLEKYSVDIQKLDYILNDYSKNQGRVFAICEERDDLNKDRDTWKRACELACREAPMHCPNPPEYYNAQDEYGSDEPYYIQESACEFSDDAERCLECQINYFYQQAKKEGNDE